MSMSSNLLKRAVELYHAGKREEANRILQAVVKQEPTNQLAWNWFIETLADPGQRIQALEEYLALYPDSQQARKALEALKSQPSSQPAKEPQAASRPAPAPQAVPLRNTTKTATQPAPLAPARSTPPYAAVIAIFSILLLVILLIYTLRLQQHQDSLQAHYDDLQTSYTNLQVTHEVTTQENEQLKAQLNDLWIDYDYLVRVYNDLATAYTGLESRFNSLAGQHLALQDQYNALYADYITLQTDYGNLKTKYETLSGDYDELVTMYTSLYGWYEWLQNNAVQPPYIAIHNRQVTLGFYRPDGSVETWTKDVSELEYAILVGAWRRDNATTIYRDFHGQTVEMYDYGSFVDPRSFTDDIEQMYYQRTSDEQFIRQLWGIVNQLTDYSDEILDTPRHPLETLLLGGGDCEDTSILLASMLLAAPVNWDIDLVLMDAYNATAADELNHMIVYVDTGWQQYWIETTSSTDMLWPVDIDGIYLATSR
jgi:uncharacterized protein YoxC